MKVSRSIRKTISFIIFALSLCVSILRDIVPTPVIINNNSCNLQLGKMFSCIFLLGRKQNLLDVIFVVGSSNLQSFLEYRDLIVTTLESPQTANSKFGVITYSSSPAVFLGLKDFVSKQDLIDRLRNIPWQGSGSGLESALQKAGEVFTNEGRMQARKVLVVYGDGPFSVSVEELIETKKTLEEKNVKVITVTVTDNKDTRKKLDEVVTTDEDSVLVDPEKPEESTNDINERILKGIWKNYRLKFRVDSWNSNSLVIGILILMFPKLINFSSIQLCLKFFQYFGLIIS
jgi:hypothetical protein